MTLHLASIQQHIRASDDVVVAIDPYLNVLAANDAAHRAWPGLTEGENLVRAVFLAPEVDELFDTAPEPVAQLVALLREGLRGLLDDPSAIALVGELSTESATFARLWAAEYTFARSGTIRVADDVDNSWRTFAYEIQTWHESPHIQILTWSARDQT